MHINEIPISLWRFGATSAIFKMGACVFLLAPCCLAGIHFSKTRWWLEEPTQLKGIRHEKPVNKVMCHRFGIGRQYGCWHRPGWSWPVTSIGQQSVYITKIPLN